MRRDGEALMASGLEYRGRRWFDKTDAKLFDHEAAKRRVGSGRWRQKTRTTASGRVVSALLCGSGSGSGSGLLQGRSQASITIGDDSAAKTLVLPTPPVFWGSWGERKCPKVPG